MAAHSYRYLHRRFPRYLGSGKVLWNHIYDVNVEMIPLRYRWGCRTFQTASHIYIRCLNTLNSCGWAYGSTLTPLPPQRFPQIWESLLKSKIIKVWKWSYYAIDEAVEPLKLHPTSMSYIYKVFEHLKQLWMGIWQHNHTVITTAVSPDLGAFAEILDNVSVEMIPRSYHWGCRTFQTASHIYVIHI
jgi:hypothetical protein